MAWPERIICLTEETTEWLYLLGEEKRIVGISAYTVRPPAAKSKPKVSAFITGNVKKICELKPDLVIGFSDIQAELAQKLIKEGLTVLITNQRTLAEIENTLLMVARIVGREKEAKRILSQWQKKLAKIRRRFQGRKRPRVFFQEWDEPIISAIPWVSELIAICGGEDVFSQRTHAMARERIVSREEVLRAQPEIILGSWCGKPMDRQWVETQFAGTPAVAYGRIYEIDSAEILQPGPALFLDGVDRLVAALWPQEKKNKPKRVK
ncbi:MAG: cobalamin-binding protein [Turneriella sp.]|nr:cobalamin-binding protein [Leptospiraceae bacterium]MCX7632186.1 cobalamin-binding protein [Turneriella sp.]